MSRFIGPYRQYIAKITDAAHEYAEAGALALISAVALGRRELNRGSGIQPNLYMLLMANSSNDRKSTIVDTVAELMRDIDEFRLGPNDFTPEALLHVMKVPVADKKGNIPPARNKMILTISEFGMVLAQTKNYAATMGATLCAVYDGTSFERVRVGAGGSLRIRDPRLTLFGGCAFNMMRQYAAEDDWSNGFYARTVFVLPHVKPPPFPSQPVRLQCDYDHIRMLLTDLVQDLTRPFSNPNGMQITAGADQMYEQWIKTFPQPSISDHIRAPQFARLLTIVLKIALLYQIDIDPFSDVGTQAMDAAIAFGTKSWADFETTFGIVSGTNRSKEINRLWQEITEAGEKGISRRDLLRNTHWPLDVVQPHIDFLLNGNVIRKVASGSSIKLFAVEPYEEK